MSSQNLFTKWAPLCVLSLALAIVIIDTTLLNVSLGVIIRDLHTNIQNIQWVISAYALTLAGLTITGGRFGDLFGRKRMFITGAFLFAVGSFLASISNSVGQLIWGEAIIEGMGAALMMPATSSLILSTYHGRDRALAFGIWGGIAAGAAAVGPILGGFLTTYYSWRWGFRINVVVVLILLLGAKYIHEARDKKHPISLDIVGVLLSASGLFSFVFGIIESSRYGWWAAKEAFVVPGTSLTTGSTVSVTPIALAMGVIILCAFVGWEIYREQAGKLPLVSMKIFQNQQFRSGVLTTMVMSLGQAGLFFSIPVFVQAALGYDALHTGLTLLPLSVALFFAAPLSAYISKHIRPKMLIQAGLLLTTLSFFVIRAVMTVDVTPLLLAPGLIVFGIGMGLVMAQISNLTLSAVSVDEAGEASGLNNTLRQVGSSLGSAIIGAVVIVSLASHMQTGIEQSVSIPDAIKSPLITAIQEQSTSLEFGGVQSSTSLPGSVMNSLETIQKRATVDANKTALLYAAAFAFLGFLVSFQLPNVVHADSSPARPKAAAH